MEKWNPVPGYDGSYEVSDLGNVRSLDRILTDGHRRSGRRLRFNRHHKNEYLSVQLCRQQVDERMSVHRLVLEAFVGPAPPEHVAAHDNGDRADNRLVNLRWSTIADNHADKRRHGTLVHGERQWNSKLLAVQAVFIRNMLDAGCEQKPLAEAFGVARSAIGKIKTRAAWRCTV